MKQVICDVMDSQKGEEDVYLQTRSISTGQG